MQALSSPIISSDVQLDRAPTTAAAVGNAFLQLGWAEPQFPPIDQMKLQKLIFYAHAWHLAHKVAPLFNEDFEAWPWGPVVRNIYLQTRDWGAAPIRSMLTELAFIGSNVDNMGLGNGFQLVAPQISDQGTLNFVRSVWDSHKSLTGIQLSNATHADGEPWTIIRNAYGNLDGKPTIPNTVIYNVFRGKLKSANPSS